MPVFCKQIILIPLLLLTLFLPGLVQNGNIGIANSRIANNGISNSGIANSGIAAFPQADGAGKYATGGRGGDVYHVTHLKDYGFGSLRYGIETATGPRTIVFDIGGVIYLQDRLRSYASNLTIAGQTAPGDGIVIAHRSFFIIDSDNVIIQNIRFAPGDGLTKPGSENLPGHIRTYDGELPPRALRIWGSSNVIVDHVTTRWGQEDNIGVTHDSRNVTIQNSFTVEALYDTDHPKGTRSYGAMAGNTYNFSFLNNLFAHNRARNPRVFGNNNLTLLEFSNNVIYHPGGWIGLFTDDALVNYIGNTGITGPQHSGPSAMIQGDPSARVYAAENVYDRNAAGPVDLNSTGSQVLDGPSPSNTRFQLQSEYSPVTPRASYIHLLSRGGASRIRDIHDRRVVRDVVERTGKFVDRPEDVGNYGDVAQGDRVVSTARDGIADWWKESKGLDINRRYHQVYSDDGYTYLEHYLQELMQLSRKPTEKVEITRTADEWKMDEWPEVHEPGDYHMLRFDLQGVRPGSIAEATLLIPGIPAGTRIMARDPFVAANKWDPGNSHIPPEKYKKTPWHLGQSEADGEFNSPNLSVFLNSAITHYPEGPEPEMITLLIAAPYPGESKPVSLIIQAQKQHQSGKINPDMYENGAILSSTGVSSAWMEVQQ